MVGKELPVYAMTLIAMSFAVAWQLCCPSDGKKTHAFSAVYHRFFERKIPTYRPLEGFFNKK